MSTFYVQDRRLIEGETPEDEEDRKEECCWALVNCYQWKQLNIWAWKPILDETYVIVILFAITCLFLPVALYIQHNNDQVHEQSLRYDNLPNCTVPAISSDDDPQICEVEIVITKDMTPPIFFYYELRNFYQNHREYVKSRYNKQLVGETINTKKSSQSSSDCAPRAKGVDDKELIACGLVSASFFLDRFTATIERPENIENGVQSATFQLCEPHLPDCYQYVGKSPGFTYKKYATKGEDSNWSDAGIAWNRDRDKYTYKEELIDPALHTAMTERNNETNGQNLPPWTDENMLVWMRVAMSQDFKKLHRILYTQDLKKDDIFKVRIENFFETSSFDGEKHIVISSMSRLGGENGGLAILYLITGSLAGVFGVGFVVIFYMKVASAEKGAKRRREFS